MFQINGYLKHKPTTLHDYDLINMTIQLFKMLTLDQL